MTEMKHGVDESFSDRLNILRAVVLGANDGIISIAGVVIGVASATSNIWIIFLSGLSAILAGAFSMAGGEYVSVSTQKDTEEAAVEPRTSLVGSRSKVSERISLPRLSSKWRMRNFRKDFDRTGLSETSTQNLVEEKYGLEYEEFTNPWHAAASSFLAFSVGSLPPMLSIILFPTAYRIPVTVFVVGLSLIFTGYTSAKLGKAPTKQAMLRNLIIGLLTMGVTYFFGQLFSI